MSLHSPPPRQPRPSRPHQQLLRLPQRCCHPRSTIRLPFSDDSRYRQKPLLPDLAPMQESLLDAIAISMLCAGSYVEMVAPGSTVG